MEKDKLIKMIERGEQVVDVIYEVIINDILESDLVEVWDFIKKDPSREKYLDTSSYILSNQVLTNKEFCKDLIEKAFRHIRPDLCNPRSVLWNREEWIKKVKDLGYKVSEDSKGELFLSFYSSPITLKRGFPEHLCYPDQESVIKDSKILKSPAYCNYVIPVSEIKSFPIEEEFASLSSRCIRIRFNVRKLKLIKEGMVWRKIS